MPNITSVLENKAEGIVNQIPTKASVISMSVSKRVIGISGDLCYLPLL